MTPPTPPTPVARISLLKIRVDPANPRMDLGDLSTLAASIKAEGLHQPIEVQPLGGGYFQVVDGHRRFGASVLAGLRTIRAEIGPARTRAEVVTTALVTGVHAKPLTAAERRRAVRTLLDEEGLTVYELASRCGVVPATVRRWRENGDEPATRRAAESPAGGSPAVTRRAVRAPSVVSVRRVGALAEEWTRRVDEHGPLTLSDTRQLLTQLRALTESAGTTP